MDLSQEELERIDLYFHPASVKGVMNVVILASGFDEAGPEGQAYQREVLEVWKICWTRGH